MAWRLPPGVLYMHTDDTPIQTDVQANQVLGKKEARLRLYIMSFWLLRRNRYKSSNITARGGWEHGPFYPQNVISA